VASLHAETLQQRLTNLELHMKPAGATVTLATLGLLASFAPGVAAQQWARIVPGHTTRDPIEQELGAPASVQFAGGGQIVIYNNVLDAAELRIAYSAVGLVDVMLVVPASRMTAPEVAALYGELHRTLGQSADGKRIVHYQLGGARVYFNDDNTVSRIEITGGVGTQGLTVEGVLRSLIGGQREKP
jgi:hypothetical protein